MSNDEKVQWLKFAIAVQEASLTAHRRAFDDALKAAGVVIDGDGQTRAAKIDDVRREWMPEIERKKETIARLQAELRAAEKIAA